jgi:hypothetical protein
MRRTIPALVVLLAFICAATMSTSPAYAAGSCSDSWGSDGHSGPWYVGSNQTLHGNTLVISCPTQSTAWKVHYLVPKCPPDGSTSCFFPIDITRSGTGDAQWSVQTVAGCNVGWLYATHVHNSVTGGDIYKPVGGKVIC